MAESEVATAQMEVWFSRGELGLLGKGRIALQFVLSLKGKNLEWDFVFARCLVKSGFWSEITELVIACA